MATRREESDMGPDLPPIRVTAEDIEVAERDDTPKPKLERLLTEPTVFDG